MAKLTQYQQKMLKSVLVYLEKTRDYIEKEKVHIVVNSSVAALPKHEWSNGDGITGIEINKHSGSELVYLYNAIGQLSSFMEAN